MAIQIVHASISENGNAGWDGKSKPGDQTGREVCTRSWYEKAWSVMLRYPDANIRKQAAEIAVKIAKSNLAGYNQAKRNTLYQALKKYNFDVDAYIKSGEKTETDCSEFMYACYACLIPKMRYDGNAPSTHSMREDFRSWGFKVHTESKYLTTDAYLMIGDILVYEGHHTVMANGNGSKVVTSSSTTSSTTTTTTTSTSNYSTGIYMITADELNVRANSNSSSRILGTVKINNTVTVTAVDGKWGKIDFKGGTGWVSLAYASKVAPLPNQTTVSTSSSAKTCIKKGQEEAVKFTGLKSIDGKTFTIDGERGPQTKKMAIAVLQTAMNKDYKSGLVVDGVLGAKSKIALSGHYVKKGEKQYMVTAAEIMMYLLGKNPNGVEYPGEFGSGLEKAAGTDRIDANMFIRFTE